MSKRDGWCWLNAQDDDGAKEWGVYGHHDDTRARQIVEGYEGEALGGLTFHREHQRATTVRDCTDCDESGPHTHYISSKPGRGAFAITWVWEKQ